MSRSPSDSEQNQPHDDSDPLPGYSEQLPIPPTLTSAETGWKTVSFEYFERVMAGETPAFCFDCYAIAVPLGQGFQLDWQCEEFARGRVQRQMLFHGGMNLILGRVESTAPRIQPQFEARATDSQRDRCLLFNKGLDLF